MRGTGKALFLAALLLGACGGSGSSADAALDDASVLVPAEGGGFCCPIDEPTCNCFRNGGWVPVDDLYECPRICDMAPPATITLDEHGCEVFWGPNSCLAPPDAGPADAAPDDAPAR
jgi:hypothetical protein